MLRVRTADGHSLDRQLAASWRTSGSGCDSAGINGLPVTGHAHETRESLPSNSVVRQNWLAPHI
jgi:hypothetical protein